MKSKTMIGIIGIIALLTIILGIIIITFRIKNGNQFSTPTARPTKTFIPTSVSSLTPTFTSSAPFMVVCTPPPCAISSTEIYYCPGVCPGGCGTTCATYTPIP